MKEKLAIYIHWPFCLSKCPYCDFNSHVASSFDHREYLSSYLTELELYKDLLKGKYISSIFFGGGTPSLMDPSIPRGIIEYLSDSIDENTEITLEANPTSSEYGKFEQFKLAGINRISVGVQSFIAKDLRALGREHSVHEAKDAIRAAKDIFDKYSFDIIYTRQGQSLEAWKDELSKIMELADGHISLYQLTIEKATPFFSQHKKGDLVLPSNDISADMYEHSIKYLRSLGYKRYEISNFAKEGQKCIHNLTYWNYDNYLGIGPGAHSRISYNGQNVTAHMNYHKPDKWMSLLKENQSPLQSKNNLSKNEILEEVVMMGLRLEEGIKPAKLEKYLGKDFNSLLDREILNQYIESGFVKYNNDCLSLTDKGMLMHSYIVPRIIKMV